MSTETGDETPKTNIFSLPEVPYAYLQITIKCHTRRCAISQRNPDSFINSTNSSQGCWSQGNIYWISCLQGELHLEWKLITMTPKVRI